MRTQKIGKAKALELFESGWWKGKSAEDVASFQLLTDELCMPFGEFQSALEKALGRGVQTIEFAFNRDGLIGELLDGKPAPSLKDILAMVPGEKLVVIQH